MPPPKAKLPQARPEDEKTPSLTGFLRPGRIAHAHVKDRIPKPRQGQRPARLQPRQHVGAHARRRAALHEGRINPRQHLRAVDPPQGTRTPLAQQRLHQQRIARRRGDHPAERGNARAQQLGRGPETCARRSRPPGRRLSQATRCVSTCRNRYSADGSTRACCKIPRATATESQRLTLSAYRNNASRKARSKLHPPEPERRRDIVGQHRHQPSARQRLARLQPHPVRLHRRRGPHHQRAGRFTQRALDPRFPVGGALDVAAPP